MTDHVSREAVIAAVKVAALSAAKMVKRVVPCCECCADYATNAAGSDDGGGPA